MEVESNSRELTSIKDRSYHWANEAIGSMLELNQLLPGPDPQYNPCCIIHKKVQIQSFSMQLNFIIFRLTNIYGKSF